MSGSLDRSPGYLGHTDATHAHHLGVQPSLIPSNAPPISDTGLCHANTSGPRSTPPAPPSIVLSPSPSLDCPSLSVSNGDTAPTLVLDLELVASSLYGAPSPKPSTPPTSSLPSVTPTTSSPTMSHAPSPLPTSRPTSAPTSTAYPSGVPTAYPSGVPSADPTAAPSADSTAAPTVYATSGGSDDAEGGEEEEDDLLNGGGGGDDDGSDGGDDDGGSNGGDDGDDLGAFGKLGDTEIALVGVGFGVGVGAVLVFGLMGCKRLIGGGRGKAGTAAKGFSTSSRMAGMAEEGTADGVGMVALSPIRQHHDNPLNLHSNNLGGGRIVDSRFASAPANSAGKKPPPPPPRRPTGVAGQGAGAVVAMGSSTASL